MAIEVDERLKIEAPRPRATAFALISVPFLVIFLLDTFSVTDYFSRAETKNDLVLLRDLIFLNHIHLCFSFYLLYKVEAFRSVFSSMKWTHYFIGLSALISALMFTNLNNGLILVLATAHAFLQSLGLYLVYFCPPSARKVVKGIAWAFLLAILVRTCGLIQGHETIYNSLGVVLCLAFSYYSKSFIGMLFSFRFFLWLSPASSSGFAIGAIHGIEYLFVVYALLKASSVDFKAMDLLFLFPFLGFLSYYTLNAYYGLYLTPISFLFYACLYSHYFFDTYAFRFKFARPRQYILPLFRRT